MAGLETREFFISKAHVRLASRFVCSDGMNLRFCEEPIPTGKLGSFGIPEVKILLEGNPEHLTLFNNRIAKNA